MSPRKPKPKLSLKTGLGLAMMMIALSLVQGAPNKMQTPNQAPNKGHLPWTHANWKGTHTDHPAPTRGKTGPTNHTGMPTPRRFYTTLQQMVLVQTALVASIQNHKTTPGLVHLVPRYNQPHLGTILTTQHCCPPRSSPEDKFKTFFENKD